MRASSIRTDRPARYARAGAAKALVIDSRFPLAEAAEAHRRIESRLAFGRVLLIP